MEATKLFEREKAEPSSLLVPIKQIPGITRVNLHRRTKTEVSQRLGWASTQKQMATIAIRSDEARSVQAIYERREWRSL